MMFGAKDAPRILRKLNEIFNQIRNTADSFKREVMYGDINSNKPAYTPPDNTGDDHDGDYEYGDDYDDADYGYGDDDESNEEVFQALEESLAGEQPEAEQPEEEQSQPETEDTADEDGDAQKT
jgi:hypothetical protein